MVLPFLAGYFLSYVYRAVNAVLGSPLATEFGLSAAQLGLFTGAFFLAVGVFQLPLGVLLDHFGPRRVNSTLLLLAAIGAALFSAADSYHELILARACIGLGVSACLMASIQAFTLWFARDRLATMIALAYSMGGLGALAASAPLELALRHFDWRQIFQALATVTIVLSAIFALIVPEHPAARKPARFGEQFAGLARIARDSAFWRVAVALGTAQCAVVSLFTLWITAWLRDVAGFDRAAAAQALAWVSIAFIAGYFFFGRLADRLARQGRSQLPLFAAGMTVSLTLLALLALGVTVAPVLVWAGFVFCGAGATLAHSMATRRYPPAMAGRVNTGLNTFTFIGIFFGQWATGVILNLWPTRGSGYDPGAYVWAFGSLWLVAALGLAWLWSGRSRFDMLEPGSSVKAH